MGDSLDPYVKSFKNYFRDIFEFSMSELVDLRSFLFYSNT